MQKALNAARLCIIPARGGSKRIPRKNIRDFCGKPMLQRSIELAFESQCFSHIVVTTEDSEIAELALKHGALVPFTRPSDLANDFASTRAVIRHAIKASVRSFPQLERSDLPVCCLYATAPFASCASLRAGLEELEEAEFVIPITSFPYPIQRALACSREGFLSMFNPEQYLSRSQDLDDAWHDVGQFYWARSKNWLGDKQPFEMTTRAVVIPRWQAQDIDTPEDWEHAEALFRALHRAA